MNEIQNKEANRLKHYLNVNAVNNVEIFLGKARS